MYGCTRENEIFCHALFSRDVSTTLVIFPYYLRREIKRGPFMGDRREKVGWCKRWDEGTRRFPERKPYRAWSPRNRYYATMILQGYLRLWPTFSHLSAPGFPICYCETSQLQMIPFGKDPTSFTGIQIVDISKLLPYIYTFFHPCHLRYTVPVVGPVQEAG